MTYISQLGDVCHVIFICISIMFLGYPSHRRHAELGSINVIKAFTNSPFVRLLAWHPDILYRFPIISWDPHDLLKIRRGLRLSPWYAFYVNSQRLQVRPGISIKYNHLKLYSYDLLKIVFIFVIQI